MVANLQQTITFTSYFIYKDSITQKFCINKQKPEISCRGKCYLKKELEKQQNNPTQQQIIESYKTLIFIIDENDVSPIQLHSASQLIVEANTNHYKKLFINKVFRPPLSS